MSAMLDGRVAVVTGGGRGIGAAIATRLAAEGATVVVTDMARDRLETIVGEIGKNGRTHGLEHDATSADSWTKVIAETERIAGALDILVNNVGITVANDLENTTLQEWHELLRVNLDAPFLGVKAALPLMRKSAVRTPFGGSIINMSSVSGIIGTPSLIAYTTSKGGVRYFSKSVALDFARKGYRIRVNSIHPGLTETESAKVLFQSRVMAGLSADVEEARSSWIANYPIGRICQPSEIAGAVLYLASDLSSYVTGTEIIVDGGLSAQ